MLFSEAEKRRLYALSQEERLQEYAESLLVFHHSPRQTRERMAAQARLLELRKLWQLTDRDVVRLRRKVLRLTGQAAGVVIDLKKNS